MRVHLGLAASLAVSLAPAIVGAQRFTGAASSERLSALPAPVKLENAGLFQAVVARVGEDVFVAGQPSERGLREAQSLGVTTVVNLRTPEELRRVVPFDEPALVKQLGMRYVYLPVGGRDPYPYSPETVAKFAEAMKQSKGKVLLHCTVAWRASHLWAAYLIKERGVPVDSALANAGGINLGGRDPRMPGRQPVEDFLDRDLPSLGRP